MIIKCQFMEVGKALFLLGTDYGMKLKPDHMKGKLEILWDEENRRAEIRSDKGFCYVTEPWIFSYEPVQEGTVKVTTHVSHPMTMQAPEKAQVSGPGIGITQPFTAQVSTPTDKVQNPKKKFAKYQGEESQGE